MSVSLLPPGPKPATRVRAEIPAALRWDLTPLFPGWEAWQQAVAAVQGKMDAYAALRGTLARGPEALLHAHLLNDEIGRLCYLVYRYPQLRRDVDAADQEAARRLQEVQAVFAKFAAATAWFTPELLALPEATVRAWIDATPALAPYRFPLLDAYRQQAHVLDEAGERLLAYATRLGQTPAAAFQELSTADIRFPTVRLHDGRDITLTPAAYGALLQTERLQADRAAAFAAYLATYTATRHTYAALYRGVLERDWFQAQSRRYPTTLDAALHHNAIPPAVVETLIATGRAGTAPLCRYLALRRRLLGLENYHLYDGSLPLVQSDRPWTYVEACRVTRDSVAPLGPDYAARLDRLLSGGWIDVYENTGKRSGAYSAGVHGVGPYLLLNYNDTLDAVFTLAHEAGHAVHTMLSHEAQPFATADCTIFVAEVASLTAERLLLDRLLAETADPRERFLLLQHAIDAIAGTFYTQTLFADFELAAHRLVERGEAVTADALAALYEERLHTFYGDAIVLDAPYALTWTRIPHFYNSPYYVYQYATCFASSAQLYAAMTQGSVADRAAAVERYLQLLRSGGSDHPMAQLLRAGVDLTTAAPFAAVVAQMDALVTQLEGEAARLGLTGH